MARPRNKRMDGSVSRARLARALPKSDVGLLACTSCGDWDCGDATAELPEELTDPDFWNGPFWEWKLVVCMCWYATEKWSPRLRLDRTVGALEEALTVVYPAPAARIRQVTAEGQAAGWLDVDPDGTAVLVKDLMPFTWSPAEDQPDPPDPTESSSEPDDDETKGWRRWLWRRKKTPRNS